MPGQEIIETEGGGDGSPLKSPFAWLVIGGILLTFGIGIVFFWTIAQQRTGVLIPVDAKPHYYIHDAG